MKPTKTWFKKHRATFIDRGIMMPPARGELGSKTAFGCKFLIHYHDTKAAWSSLTIYGLKYQCQQDHCILVK